MTLVIVQARMGSTRLPGKVLLPACGKPLLQHLVERVQRAKRIQKVVIATSQLAQDDVIADFCKTHNYALFRGDERDVLDRYVQAAKTFAGDLIVRITADCPLIDATLIDQALQIFAADPERYDMVTNRHPLTFPDGMDVDVMPLNKLIQAWREAKEPYQREHVIPYFWDAGWRIHNFEDPENGFKQHRWTLDYPEDYELIRKIIEALYPRNPTFGLKDILHYLKDKPEIVHLNSKYI